MPQVQFKDLGTLAYKKALDFQLQHFEFIKNIKIQNRDLTKDKQTETPNFFFFVTHPHVYTMGRNGNEANILLDPKELKAKGIDYHKTNRGGDITYHGYGQIVGYPIIDLDHFSGDIHLYMRNLEEVIIRTLNEYGIKGERSQGETGVWLDVGTTKTRKICAMGVHTSSWVTMHGFALNVNTVLQYFNDIIPCGITDKGVTSLQQELGKEINENEVKIKILKHAKIVFDMKFIDYKGL